MRQLAFVVCDSNKVMQTGVHKTVNMTASYGCENINNNKKLFSKIMYRSSNSSWSTFTIYIALILNTDITLVNHWSGKQTTLDKTWLFYDVRWRSLFIKSTDGCRTLTRQIADMVTYQRIAWKPVARIMTFLSISSNSVSNGNRNLVVHKCMTLRWRWHAIILK